MSGTDDERTVFGEYAAFYDTLYADKDYEAECDFLEAVFTEHAAGRVAKVLDLGCGTGGHAIPLVERGYEVTGIDRSPEMVRTAYDKAERAGVAAEFVVGDVRDYDLGSVFDAVVSMFAVVSYQLTDEDIAAMFASARAHLRPGGLFVFDGWFGPAVQDQRPQVSEKVVETPEGDQVTRRAVPTLDEDARTVEVAYLVELRREGALIEATREAHKVRYLFADEIRILSEAAGFELVALGPFGDLSRTPDIRDWNFSAVARAI